MVKSVSDASKVTNVYKTIFRDRRYVVGKGEIGVKDKTEVASRGDRFKDGVWEDEEGWVVEFS